MFLFIFSLFLLITYLYKLVYTGYQCITCGNPLNLWVTYTHTQCSQVQIQVWENISTGYPCHSLGICQACIIISHDHGQQGSLGLGVQLLGQPSQTVVHIRSLLIHLCLFFVQEKHMYLSSLHLFQPQEACTSLHLSTLHIKNAVLPSCQVMPSPCPYPDIFLFKPIQ